MWSILIVGALVVFFSLLFMKLIPPYFDNLKIRDGLDSLKDNPTLHSMTRKQIITKLRERLYVDNAHKIVDLNKALFVEKTKKDMIINVDYELVVPLAFNISALLDFENSVTKPLP